MARLSIIFICAVLLPQRCDLGGNAARRAEAEIRPYFPQAQASLTDGGRNLRTITCTNLGRKAIELLPPTIDPRIQPMKSGLARALTGITTFELGFQEDILRLDLSTGRYVVASASSSVDYSRDYNTACNAAIQAPVEAQIYVGRFRIKVLGANGETRETEIIDTLGIYRPEEFNGARDTEVEARRRFMDSELRKRGLHVVEIALIGVGRIPAPTMQPWQFTLATEVEPNHPPIRD